MTILELFFFVFACNTTIYMQLLNSLGPLSSLSMSLLYHCQKFTLAKCKILFRHTGQTVRTDPHVTQQTKWPHGKNTTPSCSSKQILQSSPSFNILFSAIKSASIDGKKKKKINEKNYGLNMQKVSRDMERRLNL